MKILNDITQILTVIASLTPFIAVGFYFGNLEKRTKQNATEIKEVKKTVQKHELILLKQND